MILEGEAAIVTGGGSGVGRATALALAQSGCSVLVNYNRSREGAERTVAEIEKLGAKAIPWKADVAEDNACRDMIAAAAKEFGKLSILVNNAGTTTFISHDDLEAVGDDDWDKILAVNVKGAFQCCRAARSAMEAAGGGNIVNVASTAGITAVGSSIPYCASKAALINLTIALARVLGPKIRVNAVAPAFITGRWLSEGLGPEAYEMTKQVFEQRASLKRVCEPEDIAQGILSLINGSRVVTGQVLVLDGGFFINWV